MVLYDIAIIIFSLQDMDDIDFQSYLDQYGSDDAEEADPEDRAELEAELYSKIHYSEGYSDNLVTIQDPTITQNVSVDLLKEFLKNSEADDVKLSKSSEEDSITEILPVQEEASSQVPLNLSCASDNMDSKYNEAARISQSSEIVLSSDSEDDSGIQVLAEDRSSRKRTNSKEVPNLVDLVAATSSDTSESEDECVPIFQSSRSAKKAKVVIEKDILTKNPKKSEVVIKRQMFNKHFRAASTSSSSTDDFTDEDEEMNDLHLNLKGCRSQSSERSFCDITKSAEAEQSTEQVPKWSKEMNSFYNDIDEEMADVTLQKILSSLPKNADWTVKKPHASTTPGRSNRSRYFQGRHCTNCNRPGHNNKVCPEPKRRLLCIMCLEEDSHVWQRCPQSRCFRCSAPGPYAESCRNCRYLDSMVCRICGGKGHVQANCTDKWRRFHATTSSNQIVKPTSNIHRPTEEVFCPNCGKQGHLVHQCRHYSFSSIPPPKTTVVNYSEPLKFKEKETIATALESKSAKKRRLREELKASKRAYLSLPNTPKQKFATKMAISKPVTPFIKSSLENNDDVSDVLNKAKTTLECLLEGKKNGKNKKRQKKWSVTLPMESDEPLEEDNDPNGTPQFIEMLKQKLKAKKPNPTNPESSAVKNKIKKEMRMLKKFNPSTIGPKKKRKLMNLINRI